MDVSKIPPEVRRDRNKLAPLLEELFKADCNEYVRQYREAGGDAFPLENKNFYPIVWDCVQAAGNVGQGYFFQDIRGGRDGFMGLFAFKKLRMTIPS